MFHSSVWVTGVMTTFIVLGDAFGLAVRAVVMGMAVDSDFIRETGCWYGGGKREGGGEELRVEN